MTDSFWLDIVVVAKKDGSTGCYLVLLKRAVRTSNGYRGACISRGSNFNLELSQGTRRFRDVYKLA